MEFTKEKLKKAAFVHRELFALVRKADPCCKGLEYEHDENGERVIIYYENCFITVDVTGDSLAALARDVLAKI